MARCDPALSERSIQPFGSLWRLAGQRHEARKFGGGTIGQLSQVLQTPLGATEHAKN